MDFFPVCFLGFFFPFHQGKAAGMGLLEMEGASGSTPVLGAVSLSVLSTCWCLVPFLNRDLIGAIPGINT